MPGVIQPAHPIVEPFGKNAGGAYIQLPVPVDSQIGITNGVASFDDGFVPLNMADPTSGGTPPRGKDMNGVMFMATQYCALMQAGELCAYNSVASTAFGGYAVGARLASVSLPGVIWTNILSGNTNDPDSVQTGWYSSVPIYASVAPTTGQHDNYVLPGASDYALDVDTTDGPVDFSGFAAQRDGQTLYISCTAASLLQILASSASSSAANRVRAPSDLGVVQNQTFTIKYFSGLGKWLAV